MKKKLVLKLGSCLIKSDFFTFVKLKTCGIIIFVIQCKIIREAFTFRRKNYAN